MTYPDYLKQKIINLYTINQKIGKHHIVEQDFNFLNKYFDNNIKPNIYSVSELLQNIIKNYRTDNTIQTKIGLDFLNNLVYQRTQAEVFFQQTPLQQPQITAQQKQDLEKKFTEVANKYGLKEFYYTLNPNITHEENYNKAILLLGKTQLELEKLQKS